MFQTKFVEKIKTHTVCPITVFRKLCHLWDNLEKYCGAGQATDDNTARAHWMLDDKGKYTLGLFNTCFSTETMVARNAPQCYVIRTLPVLFNPLKPELNSICYLLALLGAHHFLHVGRIRVKLLTFRLLMSYIHGATILDVSRSHTTTQHSR